MFDMQVVVFGAGAVGGTLGGLLAHNKNDVALVCRGEHADAINSQKGLRLRSATGDYFAQLRAYDKIENVELAEEYCVLFTPKSNDTAPCIEKLADCLPTDAPVVSFQNGVANEEIIAKRFSHLYGGVCYMTCSFIQPGRVTFRKIGRIVLGKYPKGTDVCARALGKVFRDAGFQAVVSRNIMCDKWLKLVVNIQSTLSAIIEARDHDSIEYMKLKVGLVEEAKEVLQAEKIKARSCNGKDFSIMEMISDLKKPKAQRSPSSLKVHNSTWQNLYLQRKEIENEYFHMPIIELGRKHNIPVPFNEVALEQVRKCHENKLGPEALRASDLLDEVEKRMKNL
jgi:2-dehydropantoate 2-reductase